jgi:hypothetical protein
VLKKCDIIAGYDKDQGGVLVWFYGENAIDDICNGRASEWEKLNVTAFRFREHIPAETQTIIDAVVSLKGKHCYLEPLKRAKPLLLNS